MRHLTTPLDPETIRSLHAGDQITLSGTVYTARDAAHLRMMECLKNGTPLPEMYIATGTEDFLLERIREFHNFLESRKVKHHYYESKGGHDMVFWDEYARKLVPEMFGEE